jgi:plastocyanin
MQRLRLIPILTIVAVGIAVAGCSSTGSGGAYGGGAASQAASPAAAAGSPAASPGGSSGGGGKGGYDYGGASPAPGGSGDAASAGADVVLLTGFKFQPSILTVPVGTTLRFTNNDPTAHAIVEGENGVPDSGQAPQPVPPAATVTIPFAVPGAIKVTCTIHPTMNLTVTVTP